jgi:hypothetical protein
MYVQVYYLCEKVSKIPDSNKAVWHLLKYKTYNFVVLMKAKMPNLLQYCHVC